MLKAPGSSPGRSCIWIRSSSYFIFQPLRALINIKIIHSFWVLRGFVIREKKSQDRLGKDVCKSLEIRIKLELAPTSTLRIRTIN